MKKPFMVLLILIGAFLIAGAYAQNGDFHSEEKLSNQKTLTVKIHNFQPGVLWAPKAAMLKNGDAIAGYVEYKSDMQFQRGTGVTAWYIGSGLDGDNDPHHTKLVEAKFFFKNKKGNIKTKTVKGDGGHISTGLIKGYVPYKAKVTYTTF